MPIIVKFINYDLQRKLVKIVAKDNISQRVRADGSLEIAQKWKSKISDFFVDMEYDIFEDYVFFDYGLPTQYDEYILKLAKHNLPFFTFVIDDEYTIITKNSDADYICQHMGYKRQFNLENEEKRL